GSWVEAQRFFMEYTLDPWKAIHDLSGLIGGFFRDSQWLSQNSNVKQFLRHDMQVTLMVDDLLGHKAMCCLDTAFRIVSCDVKVLIFCTSRVALHYGIRTMYGQCYQIVDVDAAARLISFYILTK